MPIKSGLIPAACVLALPAFREAARDSSMVPEAHFYPRNASLCNCRGESNERNSCILRLTEVGPTGLTKHFQFGAAVVFTEAGRRFDIRLAYHQPVRTVGFQIAISTELPKKVIVGTWIDEIKSVAPFHYAVSDATGKSVVIQITKSGLKFYDNKVNAVTNDPTYDWHQTNLQNYIGLSPVNRDAVKVGNLELRPFGQGTGMFGLPGDHSSPSRFVRAAAFANTSLPAKNASEAVFNAFHILNTFDIPIGSIRERGDDPLTDYTVWTSAADTKNAIYYYKTYNSKAVECVNVRQTIASLTKPAVIKMESGFAVRDRTSEIRGN